MDTQKSQKGKLVPAQSLEDLVLERLYKITPALKSQIRFPAVFSRICPMFCITKAQAWQVLRHLKQRGDIEIMPFKGIKLARPKNSLKERMR